MMLKDEKGQSLIEFALLLPVLFLLISGIFDFGRIMYSYLSLNMVAQESVRLGGLGDTDAQIIQYAQNNVHIGSTTVQVTITPNDTTRKSGDYVKVTLQYPLSYMTPVISNILPALTISADSTIRVE